MAMASTGTHTADAGPGTKSAVHYLALAAVWFTMTTASVVFSEPAPFDLLFMGLIILLPVVGLARLTPRLMILACGWLVVAACGFIASLYATDTARSAMHTAITLYLSLGCVVIAGFVLHSPRRHAELLASGLVVAAVIASVAGIIGYMNVVPGLYDLLTLHDRARGPFKDPNVLGAFLTPTFVMALHMCIHANGKRFALAGVALALISIALLLSFSRSAWLTTFAATVIYFYLCILVAPSNRRRVRLMLMTVAGGAVAFVVLLGALQFQSVQSLVAERATLSQTHDIGPEGRFGGQVKALRLILRAPLGIGSLEFRPRYHHEEPHNVWLAMFMNAGWIGGIVFLFLTVGTAVAGFRHIASPSPHQELYVVFYAGFIGTLMGGLVVDTDHWRHFFLLMGTVWGFMLAPPQSHLGLPSHRTAFLRD